MSVRIYRLFPGIKLIAADHMPHWGISRTRLYMKLGRWSFGWNEYDIRHDAYLCGFCLNDEPWLVWQNTSKGLYRFRLESNR